MGLLNLESFDSFVSLHDNTVALLTPNSGTERQIYLAIKLLSAIIIEDINFYPHIFETPY